MFSKSVEEGFLTYHLIESNQFWVGQKNACLPPYLAIRSWSDSGLTFHHCETVLLINLALKLMAPNSFVRFE